MPYLLKLVRNNNVYYFFKVLLNLKVMIVLAQRASKKKVSVEPCYNDPHFQDFDFHFLCLPTFVT